MQLPTEDAVNPFADVTFERAAVDRYQLKKTFRGKLGGGGGYVWMCSQRACVCMYTNGGMV